MLMLTVRCPCGFIHFLDCVVFAAQLLSLRSSAQQHLKHIEDFMGDAEDKLTILPETIDELGKVTAEAKALIDAKK